MKCSYSALLRTFAVVALVATSAAAEIKVPNETPGDPGVAANCDLTGYKGETQTVGVAIPDNNAAGITVGPIIVPADGSLIDDVVIDFNGSHTWVGDLIVAVGYDETCDGTVDAQAILMCRPRGTGTTTPAPCGTGTGFGCSGDFVTANTYLWDDTAAVGVAEGVCPTVIPGGCYRPNIDGGSPLSVFRNLRKGGCWYMAVVDNAGGDLGVINTWSVHIKNQGLIGVENVSWGNVKRLYN